MYMIHFSIKKYSMYLFSYPHTYTLQYFVRYSLNPLQNSFKYHIIILIITCINCSQCYYNSIVQNFKYTPINQFLFTLYFFLLDSTTLTSQDKSDYSMHVVQTHDILLTADFSTPRSESHLIICVDDILFRVPF